MVGDSDDSTNMQKHKFGAVSRLRGLYQGKNEIVRHLRFSIGIITRVSCL